MTNRLQSRWLFCILSSVRDQNDNELHIERLKWSFPMIKAYFDFIKIKVTIIKFWTTWSRSDCEKCVTTHSQWLHKIEISIHTKKNVYKGKKCIFSRYLNPAQSLSLSIPILFISILGLKTFHFIHVSRVLILHRRDTNYHQQPLWWRTTTPIPLTPPPLAIRRDLHPRVSE
jgi:hypothetical protein